MRIVGVAVEPDDAVTYAPGFAAGAAGFARSSAGKYLIAGRNAAVTRPAAAQIGSSGVGEWSQEQNYGSASDRDNAGAVQADGEFVTVGGDTGTDAFAHIARHTTTGARDPGWNGGQTLILRDSHSPAISHYEFYGAAIRFLLMRFRP